ncbi:monooxygenase activity protein [Marasmius tenuissimus]|nr:monooxygenase activity protein [Marasmius tenuissimus]KAJ8091404.1 monooxygenase activity protein [Marasmius tenuissimus]
MTRNPNSQAKAQKEIDEVVGRDRLPTYEDRKSLPYIEAIYREVMRWHPPGPLGGAHMNTEDDVYKDYYIPKGSLVMGNIWAITRDERRYGPDTDAFKPERFFGADGKLNDDNLIVAFGFGRRVCAGRHLADAVVWLTIATVLACFKINKPKDPETGKEMDVPENYSDGPGVFSYPLPFNCEITPRFEGSQGLAKST